MKFLFLSLFLSAPAMAGITIECGKGLDRETLTMQEREFLLYSPSHTLSGDAGSYWHLYDSLGDEIFNAKISPSAHLLLFVGSLETGVGLEYELEYPWGGKFLKAQGRKVGGFLGGRTSTLDCIVSDT